MRLFHVSEESDIQTFIPRLPYRKDLHPTIGLVWAINEKCLPNFLTPRDCPRVTYHVGNHTTKDDQKQYFSSETLQHVVAIEQKWFNIMGHTTLYLYEFDPTHFELQDEVAGFYVSKQTEKPIQKIQINDLFAELFKRNVELRVVDYLWDLRDDIIPTSLNWSMCRMGNATKK